MRAPLATYTGWALRSSVWANDGCEGSGQYIPFTASQAARVAAGDPRPSVQERYATYTIYRNKVIEAVDDLVRRRLFICDDTQDIVTRLLSAGLAAGVPPPSAQEDSSAPNPVPACMGRTRSNYHYHYGFGVGHDRDHDHGSEHP